MSAKPNLAENITAFLSAIPLQPGEVVSKVDADENARAIGDRPDGGIYPVCRVELGMQTITAETIFIPEDRRSARVRQWEWLHDDGSMKPILVSEMEYWRETTER